MARTRILSVFISSLSSSSPLFPVPVFSLFLLRIRRHYGFIAHCADHLHRAVPVLLSRFFLTLAFDTHCSGLIFIASIPSFLHRASTTRCIFDCALLCLIFSSCPQLIPTAFISSSVLRSHHCYTVSHPNLFYFASFLRYAGI